MIFKRKERIEEQEGVREIKQRELERLKTEKGRYTNIVKF